MRMTMIRLAAVAAIALGTLAVDGVNSREAHAGTCLEDAVIGLTLTGVPEYFAWYVAIDLCYDGCTPH